MGVAKVGNRKALPLINEGLEYGEAAVAYVVVWQLLKPLAGSMHSLKYRLAYVVNDECVLRYDNEAGKGDHRHHGNIETPYRFTGLNALLDDFKADIARWNDENHRV